MTNTTTMIRPVILSGGSGTRLWPISRQQFPKQFADLLGEDTLFEATLKRVSDKSRYAAPIIVSNAAHKFFILEALQRMGIEGATLLLEPAGRNTAAAAIVAALQEKDPSVLHLVLPSDHIVVNTRAFDEAVTAAGKAAVDGNLVLFGISPNRPETGYGHIIPGEKLAGSSVQRIAKFQEKPNQETAVKLMQQGALWNSGMFIYSPATLIKEAETLAAKQVATCREAMAQAKLQFGAFELPAETYKQLENAPFDTMIMERTSKGCVLPCSMGWSDIGSWQALWEISDKNDVGNTTVGAVITRDVTSSYIRSHGPTVAVMGMDKCMVVATEDAVLVAPIERSQDVKALLADIEASETPHLAMHHVKVPRPWGTYEGVAEGKNFLVKHIVVYPGRSLSLQLHHHRAEHWIVVGGTALAECDGVEKIVNVNESIYIPLGAKHRLTNPGKTNLQIIEVQSGDHLSEDDIVRFEDVYGRVTKA